MTMTAKNLTIMTLEAVLATNGAMMPRYVKVGPKIYDVNHPPDAAIVKGLVKENLARKKETFKADEEAKLAKIVRIPQTAADEERLKRARQKRDRKQGYFNEE